MGQTLTVIQVLGPLLSVYGFIDKIPMNGSKDMDHIRYFLYCGLVGIYIFIIFAHSFNVECPFEVCYDFEFVTNE